MRIFGWKEVFVTYNQVIYSRKLEALSKNSIKYKVKLRLEAAAGNRHFNGNRVAITPNPIRNDVLYRILVRKEDCEKAKSVLGVIDKQNR